MHSKIQRVTEKHSPESLAVHTRLAHQTHVVLRLGQYMLASGASAFRVQDGMARLARAVGIERLHVQMTYTTITATAWANGTFRTEVVEQRNLGVNADRIDRFNAYVQSLPDVLLVEDAIRDIESIHKRPVLYSIPVSATASGLACAGFAFLNKGGLIECLAVMVAALIGQAMRRLLIKRHVNHFMTWMVCGFVASGLYMAVVGTLQSTNVIDATHQAGMVSAVLFLVPGFPLVTSILDLIRQDFIAGISRGIYVVMLLIATAASVWAVSSIFHWSISTTQPGYHLDPLPLTAGRALATFIAAYGFAMLFNAPAQACLLAGLNGTIINVARLLGQDHNLNPVAAVGMAAFFSGIIAHVFSRYSRHSRVTLSVPAVVVMIPGVPLYRAMTAMSAGQGVLPALESTVTLLLTTTAIGVGLALARVVTDKHWRMEQPPEVPTLGDSTATIPEPFRHS